MRNIGGEFKFFPFAKHFQHLYRNDYTPGHDTNAKLTNDRSEMGKDRGKIQFMSGDYNGDGRSDISIYDSRNGTWWVGENHRTDSYKDITFRIEQIKI